jgi:hypothetical protein
MALESLPKFRIENTGAAQSNVPFTFGQVFKVGQVKVGQGFEGKLSNGELIPLQVDYKATHADGSARHAVISGVLPALVAEEQIELALATGKTTVASKATLTPSGSVELTIEGVKYTAAITNATKSPLQWLDGPVVQEWIAELPLIGPDGQPHPLLTLRAGARWYAAGPIRIEIVVENTKTWAPAARYTYDVSVVLNGAVAFEQKGLAHYHHARWRKVFWMGQEPAINVKLDGRYLMDSKAVSNYADIQIPPDRELVNIAKRTAESTGPMKIGPVMADMGSSGGRGELGPLPTFSAMWLLSMDRRARDAMMSAADGAGSWSIHYRDEKTGYPLRTDNDANKDITLHWNLREYGPLPVPRFVGNNGALGDTPYSADTAHQPSFSYLPYLVTGDYYHLEELHFWAAWNPLGTSSDTHGHGKGLVRWQQLRGQAWSLRTLGHAAYITPDDHPLKGYFTKQLDNNLDFYHQTYVVGNPNKLGVYDGSGELAFAVEGSAPWQDDFLTWSFGYLVELGFAKAKPIVQWKAKYSVGRMTAPGYCWIQGAAYGLKFKDGPGQPIYDSFEKLYKANFSGDVYLNDNGRAYTDPNGVKYIDLPCNSQAQADFLTRAHGFGWPRGRMTGYSDSSQGYPSNMQPALAIAADAGIENADKAWALLASREHPPYYPDAPQFAIVPRGKEAEPAVEVPPVVTPPVVTPPVVTPPVVTPPVVTPPVVTPPVVMPPVTTAPSKGLTITTPANKTLAKLKKLIVQVEDLNAMKLEQITTGINAATDGSVAITGSTFTKSKKYKVTIRSENNMLVGVFYPMSAV